MITLAEYLRLKEQIEASTQEVLQRAKAVRKAIHEKYIAELGKCADAEEQSQLH
jgi:hypothetical protein